MFSTTRSWAAAALSLMVCVAVPGLATADPTPTPTPTPEPTAQVPVVAVGEEPSQDYLKYSGAAMDCNTAGDRVMAALPQTSRGGYECIDPLKKTLMLYLAGGEVAVQQWTSVAQEAAAISGHTITVVPVSLPVADLEKWIDTAIWPEAARSLVGSDLFRVGANFKTSSLELGVRPGDRTWTAAQISDLLGVPVTVAEEEIPHLTPLPASATTLRLRGPLPV